MTVPGSMHQLAGPRDLRHFLTGIAAMETHPDGGRGRSTEQTLLSLYRIARHRAGPFWTAAAAHVAEIVRARVAASPSGLVGLEQGVSHTRLQLDGILLLAAENERAPSRPLHDAIAHAVEGLERLSVPLAGGTWYLHDTDERDAGENRLVLNTHVHAVIVRHALGLPVEDARRALDHALALRPPRAVGVPLGVASALGDMALGAARGRVPLRVAGSLARAPRGLAMRARHRWNHLALPGGLVARDVCFPHNPSYVMVNLNDLAVLERNCATSTSSRVLRAGLRYARTTGFFGTQARLEDPLWVLVPNLLANAGRPDDAVTAARAAADRGIAPAIGWPDHRDALWSRLAPGTP